MADCVEDVEEQTLLKRKNQGGETRMEAWRLDDEDDDSGDKDNDDSDDEY